MQFKLTIDIKGSALADEDSRGAEVAMLLEDVADLVRMDYREGYLRDSNGNSVGHWEFEEEN